MSETNLIRLQLSPAIECGAVLIVVVAIAIDIYRKRYRDWLHWFGLAYFVFHWYALIRANAIPHCFPTQPVSPR